MRRHASLGCRRPSLEPMQAAPVDFSPHSSPAECKENGNLRTALSGPLLALYSIDQETTVGAPTKPFTFWREHAGRLSGSASLELAILDLFRQAGNLMTQYPGFARGRGRCSGPAAGTQRVGCPGVPLRVCA